MMELTRNSRGVVVDLSPKKEQFVACGYACNSDVFDVFNDAYRGFVASDPDDNEVYVYGRITSDMMHAIYSEFGIPSMSGLAFRRAIKNKDDDLVIRINSAGGSVMEGAVMRQALKERQARGAKDRVVIDGAASSAAAMLALSGQHVTMAEMAMLYFHEPMMDLEGPFYAHELEETAQTLRGMKPQLGIVLDERPVDYAVYKFSGADGLLSGRNLNGTTVLAPDALEGNMIDAIGAVAPSKSSADSPSAVETRTASNRELSMEIQAWLDAHQDKEGQE